MKVTKEQAQQNRQALLDAAAALFKERGIDGTGVADICQQAGLTQGALYKHFSDKQELAAQALAYGFGQGFGKVRQASEKSAHAMATYLDSYLNPQVRDDMTRGCPLVSTACDAGRQSEAVSRSFSDGFAELRAGIEAALPPSADPQQRQALASTLVAALVGAMAISRGVVKADPALADEVLQQVRAVVEGLSAKT
ncbi:TetR/AcrR family transcriptional regulator [Comamonas sp. SY3]|uniref:TetR/AcrR family transcriptional regulator n=1 Tax=Comamonas sp. SY3 TaxID=3243601 RepID=UPI003593C6CA